MLAEIQWKTGIPVFDLACPRQSLSRQSTQSSRKSGVFVKRKCEQKGPKKVSTFSTRFHVVSNVFPKYQMLTF